MLELHKGRCPNEKKKMSLSTPQWLRSGVSKHTWLQYEISDPGVPELVAYRKPVVTYRRAGGLALTGWSARMTTSIKNP